MYELNDTIAAISSPSSDKRVIIRITGPGTIGIVGVVFRPSTGKVGAGGVSAGVVVIDSELEVDAKLYLFLSPRSYTGEDVAELHIYTNPAAVEVLMAGLLDRGVRPAGPGEFTARAYLNGKIDLAQAEAVNEIIAGSNRFQLAAAERLLAGRLAETTRQLRSEMLDCLGLIEAGIDFSGEDIEFISRSDATERLERIKERLEKLLAESVRCESVIDLPAVGIAGAANAGKSSLLNSLLGWERSIVSQQNKTTRDVLTGEMSLVRCRVVIFDCAGLAMQAQTGNILDELAQQAAVEALQKAAVVIFCVDIAKAGWAEDVSVRGIIENKVVIPVATKADLVRADLLVEHTSRLKDLFGSRFVATSSKTGSGMEQLREAIDGAVIEVTAGSAGSGTALTARHRQAITEAIEDVGEASSEIKAGNDEVAAMMLRSAYQRISNIEQHVDEQILENIFSRFCIGK